MRTTTIVIWSFAALTIASTASLQAQSFADASLTLEQARHVEMVEGDLTRAITLYRQVAESPSASRQNVARALVALGARLEIVGSTEAISTYQRVVSEFSDQPQAFMSATERLGVLAKESPQLLTMTPAARQDYTLLQEGLPAFSKQTARRYDFSPDGSKIVRQEAATGSRKDRYPALMEEVYIQDARGTVIRPVVENAEEWEFISTPRWSPVGNRILLLAGKSTESGWESTYLIHDINSDHTVRVEGNYASRDMSWMPDGNSFVSIEEHRFLRIRTLDGSQKQELDFQVCSVARLGNVSPDGRSLLYHDRESDDDLNDEIDVWSIDLENGKREQITNENGFEGWPVWSADGGSIYYAAGSETVRNLYRLDMGGLKESVQLTTYSNAAVAYPLVLEGGNKVTFTLMRDNNTIYLADTNHLDAPRNLIRGEKPELSPDGQRVYYLDEEPGRTGIWSVSVNGDDPKKIASGEISRSYARNRLLSPDGQSIAYFLPEGQTTNLYAVPSPGGVPKKLYSANGRQNLVPTWSPDGSELAFTDGPDLFVVPIEGGRPTSIAKTGAWEGWNVEWSPDGRYIAAFGYTEDDAGNVLFIVERASGELRRLTPSSEDQYKEILSWHPDSRQISYMYYHTETKDGSRIVSLDTGLTRTLVNMPDPMWDYVGVWGPDKRYYFSSIPRGGTTDWGLFVVDESTGEYETVRRVTGRSVDLPSWDKDGSTIAWCETESIRQIWMLTDFE